MAKSAAREADIRRNDNAAFKAVSVVDKGLDTAGKVVFWLRLNALLFGVLILVGILNLVL